jgi:hypothetical protein
LQKERKLQKESNSSKRLDFTPVKLTGPHCNCNNARATPVQQLEISSSTASSNNQDSVAAMLNYQSGLTKTVIADMPQNID